jgi:hypothetical protein
MVLDRLGGRSSKVRTEILVQRHMYGTYNGRGGRNRSPPVAVKKMELPMVLIASEYRAENS